MIDEIKDSGPVDPNKVITFVQLEPTNDYLEFTESIEKQILKLTRISYGDFYLPKSNASVEQTKSFMDHYNEVFQEHFNSVLFPHIPITEMRLELKPTKGFLILGDTP